MQSNKIISETKIKEKRATRKIRQWKHSMLQSQRERKARWTERHSGPVRHWEHVADSFSGLSAPNTVKLHKLPSKPTENAPLLSAVGFLFPDSLVKNSMSSHPWHTNLPSIPHLAHLWQQYGLRLYPLPPLVNMLKQMFYDPRLSDISH